jgi:hypothetical protein
MNEVIESKLNHLSLEELEIMNPEHAVYVFPIGIDHRWEKDQYVFRDGQKSLYGGPYLHRALKAMEMHRGTILYTGV